MWEYKLIFCIFLTLMNSRGICEVVIKIEPSLWIMNQMFILLFFLFGTMLANFTEPSFSSEKRKFLEFYFFFAGKLFLFLRVFFVGFRFEPFSAREPRFWQVYIHITVNSELEFRSNYTYIYNWEFTVHFSGFEDFLNKIGKSPL